MHLKKMWERREGREEGERIGEKRGKKSEQREIARRMVEKNLDLVLIKEMTGLTEQELNALNIINRSGLIAIIFSKGKKKQGNILRGSLICKKSALLFYWKEMTPGAFHDFCHADTGLQPFGIPEISFRK